MPRVKGIVVKCVLAFAFLGLLAFSWGVSHRGKWPQDGRGMETRSSSPASYMRSMKVAPRPRKEDNINDGGNSTCSSIMPVTTTKLEV